MGNLQPRNSDVDSRQCMKEAREHEYEAPDTMYSTKSKMKVYIVHIPLPT